MPLRPIRRARLRQEPINQPGRGRNQLGERTAESFEEAALRLACELCSGESRERDECEREDEDWYAKPSARNHRTPFWQKLTSPPRWRACLECSHGERFSRKFRKEETIRTLPIPHDPESRRDGREALPDLSRSARTPSGWSGEPFPVTGEPFRMTGKGFPMSG